MNYLDSKLFGSVPAPQSFGQLLDLVEAHAGERFNVYMWRGQGNLDWAIHSAAYRRLSKDPGAGKNVTEQKLKYYEERLLRMARHQGYGFENGRMLSDFEVLAKLQHHGAATRLIDCSRNLLVGLWFACKSQPNDVGLLFGIHSDHLGGYEGELENLPYKSIFSDCEDDSDSYPQTWQPPVVTKRIAAQGAQFLYSAVCSHIMGSLAFEKSCDAYIAIALQPSFKLKMLELLSGTFDIRQLTLFPDIDGFSFAHSERFTQHENDRW